MNDPLLVWWLVGAVVTLLLIVLVAWWLQRRRPSAGGSGDDRIDTLAGWPPQATRLLTTPERLAFRTLVRALPDHMVLAQVPLSRFINVPKRNSYAEWLRRLGNQCVDFLVCDMNSQTVAVVDLESAQPTERSRRRQARVARTLKAARVPLHVWIETSLPTVELARDSLLGTAVAASPAAPGVVGRMSTAGASAGLGAPSAPAPGAMPHRASAPPAVNPFEDTDRDSTQDEFIEAQEPPPSTWYDDLDTAAAPLAPAPVPPRRAKR